MKILNNIKNLLTFLFFLTLGSISAQTNTLDQNFRDYEIATFDSKNLRQTADSKRNDFIKIPFQVHKKYKWNLELVTDEAFTENYIEHTGGVSRTRNNVKLPIVLRGYGQKSNNIRATITVNDNFLYGRIETINEVIYFEPLSTFDSEASEDQIIIYKESDVIPNENNTCASETHKSRKQKLTLTAPHDHSTRSGRACRQVDLAIANDYNVVQSRGSSTSNWNAGVMANVNTDYDDSFSDEVRFVIVETFLGTSSNESPWGGSTNAETLLDNFTTWAPGGFSNNHDMGQLWTDDNLAYQGSSSTVGLAWIGGPWGCTGRYHVLEDIGNNATSLRVLVSHEIGHNFSLRHIGGSGFIMSGSINNTTSWNSTSVAALNTYIAQPHVDCLGSCNGNPPQGGGNPPVADFGASYISECNPTRLQFEDLSTNNPTSWSWSFQNGSPSTSSLEDPIIDFPGAGIYRVTLTATNDDGSDTQILNMNLSGIGNPPSASFSSSVSGFTASFNNSSSNATSYSWAFGDGNTSAATSPNHTYANDGTYSVTLTANNDCGSDTEVRNVTIVDQVTAAFTSNTTEVCEGQQITFTNQSSSNVETYSWTFENGSPSTSSAENPTVSYNNAGTFNARLVVSGGGTSDTENKVNYVTISDVPNVSFTSSVDGFNVTFDNNTLGGSTYSWAFGDGNTSTTPNPTHSYASSGTYSVTLTSTNDCGTNTSIDNVLVADEVTADFSVNMTSGCAEDSFTFTNQSSGNVTNFLWDFQGGIPETSTEENPTVSFSTPGRKDITLTVSNSLYEDIEIKNNYIDILNTPDVDFTFEVSENTVTFDNNTLHGFTYAWDFGDGNSSTQANATHTFDGPGDYIVTLSSVGQCGEGEISKTVSIESDLVARFIASSQEVCAGESVTFTNTSVGSVVSYDWTFEGGSPASSTDENPTVTFAQAGIFNVELTVSDGSTTDSESKINYIGVLGGPTASFTHSISNYTITLENQSSDAESYLWDFGDGNTSAAANPQHTFDAPGTYEVSLTSSSDCGTDEASQIITIEEILEANFESTASEICEGEVVTFSSTSVGDIASYLWEFEGASPATSTDASPVVTYSAFGTYDVTLTINSIHGGSETQSMIDYIQVNEGPSADFTYEVNEQTVTFTNLSENFSSLTWNFGDGENSSDENPVHVYSEEGNYTILLSVEGACGSDDLEIEIPVFNQLLANFTATETEICPGQEVELVDLSSGNPTSWEWRIMGEEMISLAEQNPILALDEPGIYNVELIVRNSEEEDSKIIQQYIEVMPLPEAAFTTTMNELVVEFSNNSENGNSFLWNFGDGNTSTEANPSHEYAEEGDYTVMLTVVNDCNEVNSEQTLAVYNRLVVGFGSETSEACTGTEIQFIDMSSGNAEAWNWSFPGGSPSTSNEQNPVVSYETPGEYDVSLTVNSDTEELSETKTRFVTISEAVGVDFDFVVDKNVVTFQSLASNAEVLSWSFGSQEQNPVMTYDEETTYEVSLTASNGCSTASVTKLVDLYAEASTYANFSIGTNSYCLGDEINFIDLSSQDITEWSWKFPGGSPAESSVKNPIIKYEEFGTYDVELTVSNGFNVRTIMLEDYVNVLEIPQAGFVLEQLDNQVIFENTASSYTEISYSINDELYQGDLSQYLFEENGTYIIRQLVSNACSESEFQDTVAVDVYPSAGFSLNTTTGCAPLTIEFESKSTENTSEVSWIFLGADTEDVTGLNPSVTYNEVGKYSVQVIATNEFGSDTINLNEIIEVIESPEAAFDFRAEGTNVVFSAIVGDYDEIVWDLGDGSTSNELDPVHTYDEEGNYTVTLTVYFGNCVYVYTEDLALFSSNIDEVEVLENFLVYPNPAQDVVNVSFSGIEHVVEVSLVDQLGRRLGSRKVNGSKEDLRIDEISNYPTGQYLVALIRKDKKPVYRKLVIVR